MEEKVYSRSVNKTHLAASVVDQKAILRTYTSQELSDIMKFDTWVQCDECDKWRMLPSSEEGVEELDIWNCKMNVNDPLRSHCAAKEQDTVWYNKHYNSLLVNSASDETVQNEDIEFRPIANHVIDDIKIEATKQDAILTGLVAGAVDSTETCSRKQSKKDKACPLSLISKYYFHDSLSRTNPSKRKGA